MNLRAHVIGVNVAADWWHKNRFDGHHTNQKDHDQRIGRLLAAVKASQAVLEGDIRWLERKLQNGNEKSRLDRLLDIARSVPELVRDLVGNPWAMLDADPGHAYRWAQ